MKRMAWMAAVLLVVCLMVAPASAQRKKAPTPKEVAAAATKAKLDTDHAHVVGELHVEGGVKPFPKGIWPIYVYQIGKTWHAVAAGGGKIVARAKTVEVEGRKTGEAKKPTIEFNLKITIRIGKVRITIEW